MPLNQAAWIMRPQEKPFLVDKAPYSAPEADEIVIRNSAVAVNPVDYMIQNSGFLDYLQYPNVLGCDVAGTVIETGSDATAWKAGDRVIGHAYGMDSGLQKHAGFQLYAVLKSVLTARLPDAIPFEQGVVLPCCLSTAAAALFQPSALGLARPEPDCGSAVADRGTLLVWGGSSAVGSCATQLARAAGYRVVATASRKNHDYCAALGAARVFDYRDEGAVQTLSRLLSTEHFVGLLDAISEGGTADQCIRTVLECGSGVKQRVATTLPAKGWGGVDVVPVLAGDIADNDIGPWLYHDFLPKALERGVVTPMPPPVVVGHGLDAIQSGVDRLASGLSASQIVVTL